MVLTVKWDGEMGIALMHGPPPPSKVSQGRRKRASQLGSKHCLCASSCRGTEGSGCSQQGAKFVSCLILFIAKQMPVSVLTQAPEKRETLTLNINFLSSLHPQEWDSPQVAWACSKALILSCMRVEEGENKNSVETQEWRRGIERVPQKTLTSCG